MHPRTTADQAAGTGTEVWAGWSVFSKTPGRTMDYAVLAGSFDAGVAEQYIRAGLTAHADDPGTGHPEELPWLSFVGTTGEPAAASCVMQTEWSDYRDGTGQIVTPTRLVLIPWPDAAAARATYLGQAVALSGLGWARIDGGPPEGGDTGVPIRLPREDPAGAARRVEDAGLAWAAGVAALLLDGKPVVIAIGRSNPPLAERLGLLDAVCALLPYAYRAQLSVATWAGLRVRHAMRLTFAERAVGDQTQVVLGQPPPAPVTAEAQAYLRLLYDLPAKGRTTRQIVEHLAQQIDPARCRSATDAVDLLVLLDLPAAVLRRIVAGTGDPQQVGEVLDRFGWRGLESDAMRAGYARFLAESAVVAGPARAVLQRHWSDEVVVAVAVLSRVRLAERRTAEVRIWFDIAGRHDPVAVQTLLVALTRELTARPTPEGVESWQTLLSSPPAGADVTDPELYRLFLAHPPATAELLRQFAARRDPAADPLAPLVDLWRPLVDGRWHWIGPVLAAVTGDGTLIAPPAVSALQEHWPDGVPFVLSTAVARGHADVVLEPLVEPLAEEIARRSAAAGDIVGSLHGAASASSRPGPATLARIDALLLLATGQAPTLRRCPDEPPPAYLRTLHATLGAAVLRPHHAAILKALLAVLGEEPMTAGRVRRLVAMVDAVAPELRDRVKPLAFDYLAAHLDELDSIRLPRPWLDDIGGWIPHFVELNRLCGERTEGWRVADQIDVLLRFPLSTRPILLELMPWLEQAHHLAILQLTSRLRERARPEIAAEIVHHICAGNYPGTEKYPDWLQRRKTEIDHELDQCRRARKQLDTGDAGAFRKVLSSFWPGGKEKRQ